MRMVSTCVAWTLAVLSCSTLAPSALQSQEAEPTPTAPAIESGTRVRVTAPFVLPDRIEGSMESATDDTLQVNTSAGLVKVPVENLQKLEVSTGRRANVGRGAIYGTAIGGLTGLALGLIDGGAECSSSDAFCLYDYSAGQMAAMGLLTGAALGAAVGAIVGAIVKTEKWETVPVSALSLGPDLGGGWRVAMSVGFR